jgi:probable F420-dependent oxidoreductase
MAPSGPKVGVFPASTDRSMPIVELARAAELRGFRGIFLNEHTHVPVDHPRSRFPAGGEIPERYARFWDPYVALSFVAAQTDLEVGTCISLVAEHDAIALAKQIATLDVMSGGRFVFGVGWGWLREEVEDHGFDARDRVDVVRETVELMRRLWTQDEASYAGRFRRVSASHAWPKPVQDGGPPVLLGAPASERNFQRVARWADGWIPMGSPLLSDEVDAQIQALREAWKRAERDPATLRLTAIQWPAPPEQLRRALGRAGELGFERVVLYMADDPEPEALAILDAAAEALDLA